MLEVEGLRRNKVGRVESIVVLHNNIERREREIRVSIGVDEGHGRFTS